MKYFPKDVNPTFFLPGAEIVISDNRILRNSVAVKNRR